MVDFGEYLDADLDTRNFAAWCFIVEGYFEGVFPAFQVGKGSWDLVSKDISTLISWDYK